MATFHRCWTCGLELVAFSRMRSLFNAPSERFRLQCMWSADISDANVVFVYGVPSILGRLGDTINFKDLPSNVQTTNMASLVGALGTRLNDGFEACGSPGEVANDPTLGWKYT